MTKNNYFTKTYFSRNLKTCKPRTKEKLISKTDKIALLFSVSMSSLKLSLTPLKKNPRKCLLQESKTSTKLIKNLNPWANQLSRVHIRLKINRITANKCSNPSKNLNNKSWSWRTFWVKKINYWNWRKNKFTKSKRTTKTKYKPFMMKYLRKSNINFISMKVPSQNLPKEPAVNLKEITIRTWNNCRLK